MVVSVRQGLEHFWHMGRVPGPEADGLLDDLFAAGADGTRTLDEGALRSRLATVLSDTADGIVIRTLRGASGNTVRAFIPFEILFPANGRGFILPELQSAFRTWAFRQKELFDGMHDFQKIQWLEETYGGVGQWDHLLQPQHQEELLLMFFGPKAFIRAPTPGSRGEILIDALMGPSAIRVLGVEDVPTTYTLKMWPGTNARRVVREVPEDAATLAAARFQSRANLEGIVREALADLSDTVDDAQVTFLADFMEAYIARHSRRGELAQWHSANRVEGASPPATLLEPLDDPTLANVVVTEHTVRSIAGNRDLHPVEIVHRMIEAQSLIDQWIKEITGNAAGADLYKHMDGFDSLFDAVIRRDGYQKGHVFEVECLVDVAPGGAGAVRLQFYLAGKKGPDFIVEITSEGVTKLYIKQAKSYGSYYRLVGPQVRFDGEFLRQLRSDLRRMLEEGEDLWVPGQMPHLRLAPGDTKPIGETYEFLVDQSRLAGWIDPASANGAQRLVEKLDTAIGRFGEFTAEINGYLRAGPNDSAARAAILYKCREFITAENGIRKRVRDHLEEQLGAVADGIPGMSNVDIANVHPRLLFAMRLAMDDKTGVVNVKLAQRIYRMPQPLQIEVRTLAPKSAVFWEGELPDKLARQYELEDAMESGANTAGWDPLIYSQVD